MHDCCRSPRYIAQVVASYFVIPKYSHGLRVAIAVTGAHFDPLGTLTHVRLCQLGPQDVTNGRSLRRAPRFLIALAAFATKASSPAKALRQVGLHAPSFR